jgi:murein DD-endopeptidase MepM/ murein hydrolase activator NlpD
LRTASRTDLATEAAPSKGTDKPRSDSEAESRATASPDLETQSPATAKPGPDRLALASGGPFELPAPYLAFSRPFAEGLEQRGSSFYPYGTTGGGEYLLHHGVDIGNPMGTIVRAVGDGEVVFAGTDAEGPAWGARDERYPEGFYGRLVVIRHAEAVEGRPLYSLYGHLSRLLVQRRQHVKAGQAIAAVGSAGIALGPHLHLEFRSAAQDYMATLNPELYVANLDGLGLIVGRLTDPAGKPLAKIDIGLYSLGDDGRETWIRQTSSYPSERINSSPGLGENFVFADVEPGRYRVAAVPGGGRLTGDLTVVTGRPSAILLHR